MLTRVSPAQEDGPPTEWEANGYYGVLVRDNALYHWKNYLA